MQELQLVSTGKVIIGGTTKPFTVLALNEKEVVETYVVKAFTKNQIAQNASVAKEIIVCELANVFDLTSPEYGIINLSRLDLERVYEKARVAILDPGAKFCSKYMGQYTIFTDVTSKGFLKDYEILNIFAFDVFILNVDRGGHHNKPNTLINDNELMIIDHELTFPFINYKYKPLDYENRLGLYQHKRHVLVKYIRSLPKKDRNFDDFLLSLSSLNINKLNTIFDEMDSYNIAYFDRANFLDYFVWAKRNVSIFERYLIAMTR